MKILTLTDYTTETVLQETVAVLQHGGLVVYPTETCYGLGADATNPSAVRKLLSYKRRREGKPLSIMVADQTIAERYVLLNDSARRLYERFLPGPLTVISKDKGLMAEGVASERNSIGIRISSHPIASELAKRFGKPVTATSANASWKKKPYSVDDILSPLTLRQKALIDIIIDAGELPKREASTVVDTTIIESMVLRQGEITFPEHTVHLISDSEKKTQELAAALMLKYWNDIRDKGFIIGLIGDLGAGKTVFAKGVGAFLHIPDEIVSPSYTLSNEYRYTRYGVKGVFNHLDPWRLETFQDLEKVGIHSMFGSNNIIVIEWASKFQEEISKVANKYNVKLVMVHIKELDDHTRELSVE